MRSPNGCGRRRVSNPEFVTPCPPSGRGRIYSFVTYHRLYHEGWQDELPYVVAVVELEEGPRMISNIVGIEPDKVVCDMTVEVTFDDVTADVTLPKFRPA